MNHTLSEMIQYKKIIESVSFSTSLLLCPALCYLPLMHSKKYSLGGQNVSLGSLTGEISVEALKSLDVKFVLIGHSEVNDSFEVQLEKIKQCVSRGIAVYIILSDTKEEYDYQYTFLCLYHKIQTILKEIPLKFYSLVSFIYEPVFVIGTRSPLEVSFVEDLFYRLKVALKQSVHYEFLFLYGGGLFEKSILPFLHATYIDGLLLGSYGNSPDHVLDLLQNTYFRQN